MIFRQLFDSDTSTFTYLMGDESSREAVLIDPVDTKVPLYQTLLKELGLVLVHAMDTHVHADHVTALGMLRQLTGCQTYIGRAGSVACSDHSLANGMEIRFGAHCLKVFYTPGHTDDSYSFLLAEDELNAVFTGDTLLIRGTGRTDFQNGSSASLFESLHDVLLTLPGDTKVYPGHDYRGMTVSTIAEEKLFNPRLQWSKTQFIENMARLDLPDPKYIDIAVPANKACGDLSKQ